MDNNELTVQQLCRKCSSESLSFESTAELDDITGFIGQDRAVDALKFGIGINQDGYNLYAQGPAGLGKHSIVNEFVTEKAGQGKVPDDWCYINNFKDARNPIALSLPAGLGRQLKLDMGQLIEELRVAIPSAFESEQYHARAQEVNEEYEDKREEALLALSEDAEKRQITLLKTPSGYAFAPLKNGKVIPPEAYDKLPQNERDRIEALIENFEEELTSIIRQEQVWKKDARNKIKQLHREVTELAVGHLIDDMKEKYANSSAVQQYLGLVRADVIENVNDFRTQQEAPFRALEESGTVSFQRYEVNVISDHTDDTGAPVIYEDSPSYESLVGKIEHLAHMGTLFTDFTMVKSGALHKANGGYLVLDVQKVLMHPYAWEGLKRALFSKEISVKSLGEIFSLVSTTSLEPEPIPLDVKVILIGDRLLNYLLCAYDNEFSELFKVSVDFEEQVERSDEHFLLYARMIGTIARKHNLLPLDKQAVARVIEYSSRLSSDASKMSTHMMSISDLVKESDYWAREEGGAFINNGHIQQAIDKQKYRSSRIQERIYEHIKRRSILIETRGEVIGQVNGLSVMSMGNYSFGQPSRITATARLGDGEVMDIEREVELGGAIHSKGVLILSSYIASTYSHDMPLSLNASLVFEQSYGGVEGDSATIAECCALLSVLADVPVRQSLAVTGSMNQFGFVQAIGGVNEKIEGFFEVCKQNGLSGEQGVIIPESNVDNLMLNSDVVDAVADGKFHIYSISTVNEAVSLLTGVEAGEVDENGDYPEGTINSGVSSKLMQYSQARLEFNKQAKE